MSHTVKVAVAIKDKTALLAAIDKLGLQVTGSREGERHRMYGGRQVDGIGVQLEGWQYPVVIDFNKGEAVYDNFGGHWGAQQHLDKLVQEYTVEKTRLEAMEHGYTVTEEEELENGDKRVLLTSYAE